MPGHEPLDRLVGHAARLVANALIPAVGEIGLFGMVTAHAPSPLLPMGVGVVAAAVAGAGAWSVVAARTAPPRGLRGPRAVLHGLAMTGLNALFPLLMLAYAGFCVAALATSPAPTPVQSDALATWAVLTGLGTAVILATAAAEAARAWKAATAGGTP